MDPSSDESKEVALQTRLAQQHPLHGMMGEVLIELGGTEFLLTWAEENPTEFVKVMMKLAPPAVPKGVQGGIHLHVHSDLKPTALDAGRGPGVVLDDES